MTKIEFIADLYDGLAGLPEEDVQERLNYYSEMIDDRMEDGLSEAEAVSQIGTPEEIISQILAETPITRLIRKKRRLTTTETVLLCAGAPLWAPLLIAAFAVGLSLYISWWAVIISLWSVFVALAGIGIGGVFSGVYFAFNGNALTGLAVIGAGFVCIGLSIFAFYGCKAATKGTVILTKKLWLNSKKRLVRKEKGV